MEHFSEKIKKRRKEMGLTLKELGDMTGLSPSYISKIENGERKAPSWEVVVKIEEALQLNEIRDESRYPYLSKVYNQENLSVDARIERVGELIKMYANRGNASFKEIMGLLVLIEDIIYNNESNQ